MYEVIGGTAKQPSSSLRGRRLFGIMGKRSYDTKNAPLKDCTGAERMDAAKAARSEPYHNSGTK